MNTIRDIPIRVDATWYVFMGLLTLMGLFSGGLLGIVEQLLPLMTVYFVVVLHEYGHAWAALKCGVVVKEIRVWLLGGIAYIEGNRHLSNKEDLFISLAGPAVNALLGVVALLVWAMGFGIYPIKFFAGINIMLFLFNMLPAYPMDGGRILRALLSFKYSHYEAEKLTYRIGKVMAIGMGVLGLYLTSVFLILIACYIFYHCHNVLIGRESPYDNQNY